MDGELHLNPALAVEFGGIYEYEELEEDGNEDRNIRTFRKGIAIRKSTERNIDTTKCRYRAGNTGISISRMGNVNGRSVRGISTSE